MKILHVVGARPQFIKAAPVGKALRAVTTPHESPDVYHVYHQYTIRVEQRDALAAYLKERDIGTMVYYPVPLHLQELYADLGYGEGSPSTSSGRRVEIKAVRTLAPEHEAQLLNYLKATPYEVGLLLNPSTGSGQRFGPEPQIKRKIYDNPRKGGMAWMKE